MLFLQPVVVNDAHAADQSPAAEVRVVDRRTLEPPAWPGAILAQSSVDQRSPFGNNAPTSNELTPRPRMVNPDPGTGQPADPMSTTKIPPAQGQPDAGPPPPSSGSSGTPNTEPGTATPNAAPGTTIPTPNPSPSTTMPQTTPQEPTPGTTPGGGAGAPLPTVPDSRSVPPVPPPPGSSAPATPPAGSSTIPGASSGASNTR
jgi:hypothetical protein